MATRKLQAHEFRKLPVSFHLLWQLTRTFLVSDCRNYWERRSAQNLFFQQMHSQNNHKRRKGCPLPLQAFRKHLDKRSFNSVYADNTVYVIVDHSWNDALSDEYHFCLVVHRITSPADNQVAVLFWYRTLGLWCWRTNIIFFCADAPWSHEG